MALLKLRFRRVLLAGATGLAFLILATLQIEHVLWPTSSCATVTQQQTDSTPPPETNRLAEFLAHTLYNHRNHGDIDHISFAYNNTYAQHLWRETQKFKRHLKTRRWYHKTTNSMNCTGSEAHSLWGDYQVGGLLCDVYDLEALDSSRRILPNVISAEETQQPSSSLLTLVTHMTGDRISRLEKIALVWKGPISVGVYSPGVDLDSLSLQWDKNKVLRSRRNIALHVVVKRPDELFYPVNVVRNLALREARTDFVFLTDADLVPSRDMEQLVTSYLSKPGANEKEAIVIPAFEMTRKTSSLTNTKHGIVEALSKGTIQPFLVNEYPNSYEATNYTHWLTADRPYKISYTPGFEPYVVISKKHAPPYDDSFVGYYLNKISYILELHIAGFEFRVFPSVFTLHVTHPDKKAPAIRTHLTCVMRHFVNFLRYLEATYCVRFVPYAADLFS